MLVYWCAMVFLSRKRAWRFSLLVCGVLLSLAVYLGFRDKQEIRTGMAGTAATLAPATLPLTFGLASLESW